MKINLNPLPNHYICGTNITEFGYMVNERDNDMTKCLKRNSFHSAKLEDYLQQRYAQMYAQTLCPIRWWINQSACSTRRRSLGSVEIIDV